MSDPITRKESYLAAIAGDGVDYPEIPLTREEAYLKRIAENGTGGGGVPVGGTAGQVMVKNSDVDYDTRWADLPKGKINNAFSVKASVKDHVQAVSFITTISGFDYWTDGVNRYATKSYSKYDYIYDESKKLWASIDIKPDLFPDFMIDPNLIWTDGVHTYMSTISGITNYKQLWFDTTVKKWKSKTWNGLTDFDGYDVWTDGTDIYCSMGSVHYVLDVSTSTWSSTSFNIDFSGAGVWSDGDDIYCMAFNRWTEEMTHYKFDKTNKTWSKITWNINIKNNSYIWSDGTDTYYSDCRNDEHYVLNKVTGEWDTKTWTVWGNYSLSNVPKKDGDNIVSSSGYVHLVLKNDEWVLYDDIYVIYDNGVAFSYVADVWSDGTYIYHTTNSGNLILNKSDKKWVPAFLLPNAVFDFRQRAIYIWSDGNDIYFSNGNSQYILDKTAGSWNDKDWGSNKPSDGECIWSDGENIYYSYNGTNYVLDKANDVWEDKTWGGLSNINGSKIWSDGENIYFSNGSNQYVLDKSTDTWIVKEWSGLGSFDGSKVWFDGEDIRYSNSHVLDRDTDTWIASALSGVSSGDYPWTDGENIYLGFYHVFEKGKNISLR